MTETWATRMPPHIEGLLSQQRKLEAQLGRLELLDRQRHVLGELIASADGAGFCFMSLRTLVEKTRYSRRSILRALKELREGDEPLIGRYKLLRTPDRYPEHLPHRARFGRGPNIYRLGWRLRSAAGLHEVDLDEHLRLVRRAAVAPPNEDALAPPGSEALAPPRSPSALAPPSGTPEIEAISLHGRECQPDDVGTPITENGKACSNGADGITTSVQVDGRAEDDGELLPDVLATIQRARSKQEDEAHRDTLAFASSLPPNEAAVVNALVEQLDARLVVDAGWVA